MSCNQDIVGPFVHTLFLGASITRCSLRLGWNGEESQLSVELVEDLCPSQTGKLYYDGCLNPQIHYGSDFFNPPKMGSPVYFKLGSLEFGGILKSWQQDKSTSAGRTFTVIVSSPVNILDDVQVILGKYTGQHFNIPNLINVYGFLESLGNACSIHPSLLAKLDYSPASGYGGANQNDGGVSWNRVRTAINLLVNSWPGVAPTYGQTIQLRDSSYFIDLSEVPTLGEGFRFPSESMSLMEIIRDVCAYTGRDFFVEMVYVPTGSCSEQLAQQIDGKLGVGVQKFIKIRTIWRYAQPLKAAHVDNAVGSNIDVRLDNFGSLTSAITDVYKYPVDFSRGLELREETTNAMIVGDNRLDIWQVWNQPSGDIENDDAFTHDIWPYWGKDDTGVASRSKGWGPYHVAYLDFTNQFDALTEAALQDQHLTHYDGNILDISVSENLDEFLAGNPPFGNRNLYVLSAGEAAAVMSGFDEWENWIHVHRKRYLINHGINALIIGKDDDGNNIWREPIDDPLLLTDFNLKAINLTYGFIDLRGSLLHDLDGVPEIGDKEGWHAELIKRGIAKRDFLRNTSYYNLRKAGLLSALDDIDATTKVYNWLSGIVSEYFGKQFVVKLPSLCYRYNDDEPNTLRFNMEPADAGWEDGSVLRLPNDSDILTFFRDVQDGRITPFVYVANTGLSEVDGSGVENVLHPTALDVRDFPSEEYILLNPYEGYFRCQIDKLIFLDPLNIQHPRAVIRLSNPVYNYVLYEDDGEVCQWRWQDAATIDWVPELVEDGPPNDILSYPGMDKLRYPMLALPLMPQAAAIPMLQNELCYGPWAATQSGGGMFYGPPSDTDFEVVADLNPWNYGSTARMNTAGYLYVNSKVTQQVVSERGNISVPGLPGLNLGRRLVTGGPEVTSIDVSVGIDGVHTSYEMRTHIPNYGEFSKRKIDALRKYGQFNTKLQRMFQRAKIDSVKDRQRDIASPYQAMLTADERFNRHSSLNILFGHAIPGYQYNEEYTDVVADGTYTQAIYLTDITKMGMELRVDDPDEYAKRGGADLTSVFRMYQTHGGSSQGFPVLSYGGVIDPVDDLEYNETTNRGGFTPGRVFDEELPPIHGGSLSPFMASGYTTQGFPLGFSYGHDVEYVIRDGAGVGDEPFVDLSVRHPTDNYSRTNDYRAVGLKAPLVLVGWGYDIYGRPVPNYGEYDNGIGYTAFFADNWLRDTSKWKAGPLDVRWDANRGVWTSPQYQQVYRARFVENKPSGYMEGFINAQIYRGGWNRASDKNGNDITDSDGYGNVMVNTLYGPSLPILSGYVGYVALNDYVAFPEQDEEKEYCRYNIVNFVEPTYFVKFEEFVSEFEDGYLWKVRLAKPDDEIVNPGWLLGIYDSIIGQPELEIDEDKLYVNDYFRVAHSGAYAITKLEYVDSEGDYRHYIVEIPSSGEGISVAVSGWCEHLCVPQTPFHTKTLSLQFSNHFQTPFGFDENEGNTLYIESALGIAGTDYETDNHLVVRPFNTLVFDSERFTITKSYNECSGVVVTISDSSGILDVSGFGSGIADPTEVPSTLLEVSPTSKIKFNDNFRLVEDEEDKTAVEVQGALGFWGQDKNEDSVIIRQPNTVWFNGSQFVVEDIDEGHEDYEESDGRAFYVKGVGYVYHAVATADYEGNTIDAENEDETDPFQQEGLEIYLPCPSNKTRSLWEGDDLFYTFVHLDGQYRRVCVSDCTDDKLGTVKGWDDSSGNIPNGWEELVAARGRYMLGALEGGRGVIFGGTPLIHDDIGGGEEHGFHTHDTHSVGTRCIAEGVFEDYSGSDVDILVSPHDFSHTSSSGEHDLPSYTIYWIKRTY